MDATHSQAACQSIPLSPLSVIDVDRLNALLKKCRSARQLTKAEKIQNAEALAPMAEKAITDRVAAAFDAGRAAYLRGNEIRTNPYSNDDRPLEWEAWCEGYEHARSGLETDA